MLFIINVYYNLINLLLEMFMLKCYKLYDILTFKWALLYLWFQNITLIINSKPQKLKYCNYISLYTNFHSSHQFKQGKIYYWIF